MPAETAEDHADPLPGLRVRREDLERAAARIECVVQLASLDHLLAEAVPALPALRVDGDRARMEAYAVAPEARLPVRAHAQAGEHEDGHPELRRADGAISAEAGVP